MNYGCLFCSSKISRKAYIDCELQDGYANYVLSMDICGNLCVIDRSGKGEICDFDIDYCPICGRKLKTEPKNDDKI